MKSLTALQKINNNLSNYVHQDINFNNPKPQTTLAPLGGRSGSADELLAMKRMSPYNNTFGSNPQIGSNLNSRQIVQFDASTKIEKNSSQNQAMKPLHLSPTIPPLTRPIPRAASTTPNKKLTDMIQLQKQPIGSFFVNNAIPPNSKSIKSEKPVKARNSDKTQVDDQRRNNSARQYLIKKTKGKRDLSRPKKNNGNKSPTQVTFSYAQSTKSAPNLHPILNEKFTNSPDHHIKTKASFIPPPQATSYITQVVRIKAKGYRQLSTSPVPQRVFHSQTPSASSLPNTAQSIVQKYSQSVSKERPLRKILPVKTVKFINQKLTQENIMSITPVKQRPLTQTQATLPKPPLAKRKEQLVPIEENRPMTSEALLKMADEGISELKAELQRKKRQAQPDPQRIQAHQAAAGPTNGNFNLSFNNSFNTSYNQTPDKPHVVINSETKAANGDIITHQVVADLEERFTTNLKALGNEKQTLGVVSSAFDEVILRDKCFASLLKKIKNAYTDYLQELEGNTARKQVIHNTDLEKEKQINAELQKQINSLKQSYKEKDDEVKLVYADLEKLKLKQFQLQVSKNQKSFSSVGYSQTSPAINNKQRKSTLGESNANENSIHLNLSQTIDQEQLKTSRTEEVNYLIQQNIELNDLIATLQDEATYLKLREKKIMYLVHLLQAKGYPVTQIFEAQVKPINTLRFEEFLIQKEREAKREEEENAKVDFSFYTEDSFFNIVEGPQIKPIKPEIVPDLNFQGLPEYETSSEEEEAQSEQPTPVKKQTVLVKKQPQQVEVSDVQEEAPPYYQQSMKYIENYYTKHQM